MDTPVLMHFKKLAQSSDSRYKDIIILNKWIHENKIQENNDDELFLLKQIMLQETANQNMRHLILNSKNSVFLLTVLQLLLEQRKNTKNNT